MLYAALLPCLQVLWEVRQLRGTESDLQGTRTLLCTPTTGTGRGVLAMRDGPAEDSPALGWDEFWSPASPYCRGGEVQGRFTLALADS